jgi:hypothetical protein
MPLFVMRITYGLPRIYLSLCSYPEKKPHAGSNLGTKHETNIISSRFDLDAFTYASAA